MNNPAGESLKAYAAVFGTLSPENMSRLDDLVCEDVVFADPFHRVVGRDAMYRILAGMFDTFPQPGFKVHDLAMGSGQGFIHWEFTTNPSDDDQLAFSGTSVVAFDSNGRVTLHQDYWDAASAVYSRLPVVGPMVRFLNRRIAASSA